MKIPFRPSSSEPTSNNSKSQREPSARYTRQREIWGIHPPSSETASAPYRQLMTYQEDSHDKHRGLHFTSLRTHLGARNPYGPILSPLEEASAESPATVVLQTSLANVDAPLAQRLWLDVCDRLAQFEDVPYHGLFLVQRHATEMPYLCFRCQIAYFYLAETDHVTVIEDHIRTEGFALLWPTWQRQEDETLLFRVEGIGVGPNEICPLIPTESTAESDTILACGNLDFLLETVRRRIRESIRIFARQVPRIEGYFPKHFALSSGATRAASDYGDFFSAKHHLLQLLAPKTKTAPNRAHQQTPIYETRHSVEFDRHESPTIHSIRTRNTGEALEVIWQYRVRFSLKDLMHCQVMQRENSTALMHPDTLSYGVMVALKCFVNQSYSASDESQENHTTEIWLACNTLEEAHQLADVLEFLGQTIHTVPRDPNWIKLESLFAEQEEQDGNAKSSDFDGEEDAAASTATTRIGLSNLDLATDELEKSEAAFIYSHLFKYRLTQHHAQNYPIGTPCTLSICDTIRNFSGVWRKAATTVFPLPATPSSGRPSPSIRATENEAIWHQVCASLCRAHPQKFIWARIHLVNNPHRPDFHRGSQRQEEPAPSILAVACTLNGTLHSDDGADALTQDTYFLTIEPLFQPHLLHDKESDTLLMGVDWSFSVLPPYGDFRHCNFHFFEDEFLEPLHDHLTEAICQAWNGIKALVNPERSAGSDLTEMVQKYANTQENTNTVCDRITSYSDTAFVLETIRRINSGEKRKVSESHRVIALENISSIKAFVLPELAMDEDNPFELHEKKRPPYRPPFFMLRLNFREPVTVHTTNYKSHLGWLNKPDELSLNNNDAEFYLSGRLSGLIEVRSALERCRFPTDSNNFRIPRGVPGAQTPPPTEAKRKRRPRNPS